LRLFLLPAPSSRSSGVRAISECCLALATSQDGWASLGFPQWGRFRFGHSHPEYSSSGPISVLAEVYAGTGKVAGLTSPDAADAKVGDFVGSIEKAVVHWW